MILHYETMLSFMNQHSGIIVAFSLIIVPYWWRDLCNGATVLKNEDADIRLIDGTTSLEGTVLVYRGYAWGTICDDEWDMKDAEVVCRQMGMGQALAVFKNNKFNSKGLRGFLLDDVRCHGNESRISHCKHPGWGKHDCKRHELAGVRCSVAPPKTPKLPSWNPLSLQGLKEKQLRRMRETRFHYSLQEIPQNQSGFAGNSTDLPKTYLLVAEVKKRTGVFCGDYFKSPEANVVCREKYGLLGGRFFKIPIEHLSTLSTDHLLLPAKCYGNETSLEQCITYASDDPSEIGTACQSNGSAVAIVCTDALPDILADALELERSSYLQRMPLWHLECALSENCLPEEVYQIKERNPNSYQWIPRSLLRFSSIIENAGTGDFLPFEPSEKWEWHACHFHYHSMKVFARYEIIMHHENETSVIASGHKASFCLEDNYCKRGVTPIFRCSNIRNSKGTQGISPGCKDTYLHDYDCQWVDITSIKPGRYVFQMILNPDFMVPESNFNNNAVVCDMHFIGVNAVLRKCVHQHPMSLLHL